MHENNQKLLETTYALATPPEIMVQNSGPFCCALPAKDRNPEKMEEECKTTRLSGLNYSQVSRSYSLCCPQVVTTKLTLPLSGVLVLQ